MTKNEMMRKMLLKLLGICLLLSGGNFVEAVNNEKSAAALAVESMPDNPGDDMVNAKIAKMKAAKVDKIKKSVENAGKAYDTAVEAIGGRQYNLRHVGPEARPNENPSDSFKIQAKVDLCLKRLLKLEEQFSSSDYIAGSPNSAQHEWVNCAIDVMRSFYKMIQLHDFHIMPKPMTIDPITQNEVLNYINRYLTELEKRQSEAGRNIKH